MHMGENQMATAEFVTKSNSPCSIQALPTTSLFYFSFSMITFMVLAITLCYYFLIYQL